MEPAGGVAWPARGVPADGSTIRRELPSSTAWEPPLKKVRNDAFQATANTTYARQETANHTKSDALGVLSPRLSHLPTVHAAGEQVYGGQESFGSQSMPAYGGQQQIQPSNGCSQDDSHAVGRSFNMAPQSSSHSSGFPPGSAKSTASLFLKTKLCTKFKLGTCTFNERCHFAHGIEDLRKPPVGWETMVASAGQGGPLAGRTSDGNIQRKKSSKPCRFFADGKECPYGDRCTFVHVPGEEVYPVSGFGSSESGGLPAPRLKTRMCAAWERGEACNYGERCHYAHGYAELQSNTGASAYTKNHTAPIANVVQYSNTNSEAAPYSTQFSNTNNMNAPPAAAPLGQSFLTATSAAPFNAYPTMGIGPQQQFNASIVTQGDWSATSAQGGFPENQTAGLWTGHASAEGGYTYDSVSASQNFPAQVHQQPVIQSYATGNVSLYQDPKQSVNVPYVQGGGSANFQSGAIGGNGGYYAASYLPNYPN